MKLKTATVNLSNFKAVENDTMKFTCYGNVKGNIDHARDRTLDGAYEKSIQRHKDNGTMPKMFWMHNPYELPVGKWINMYEDTKGLFLEGQFSNTEKGREIYSLMKDGALDSFSIGYSVVEERWNQAKGCNDLVELDIKEISIVNFACNEESLLQGIKSHMDNGQLPSKAELRELFKSTNWFSKRQIERITAAYNPVDDELDLEQLGKLLEGSSLFK